MTIHDKNERDMLVDDTEVEVASRMMTDISSEERQNPSS